MAEQISSENTKKLLLEGAKETPQIKTVRRRQVADVVVENSTEKRYLWTARAFAIIFAVSLCCNFILVYAIFTVIPLYRVEPYLFSFVNKDEQVYKVEPVRNILDHKQLTEIFIREYILLRNTFINDIDEMQKRWGPGSVLQEMSSPAVYDEFRKKTANRALELIRNYNLTRNIKISTVNEIAGAEGDAERGVWWQVEFRLEDMTPDAEIPQVETWNAHVRIKYNSKTVKFSERLKNPLGFTVEEYLQKERKLN